MAKLSKSEYKSFITEVKQNIIRSRYQAARRANHELLLLYLSVGNRLSEKIRVNKWGAKVLQRISLDLQHELPGLRGFSERNLVNMTQFANEYAKVLFTQSSTAQMKKQITQSSTAQMKKRITQSSTAQMKKQITQSSTAQTVKTGKRYSFTQSGLNSFFSISFTHHILLLNKCKDTAERVFYMQMAAGDMWSVSTLEHHIEAKLYKYQGKLPNNFKTALPQTMRSAALNLFKDEYLFDFMALDDSADEQVFEETAVTNIRKFIMRLGRGFSFIGNQYKVEVSGNEYFIDLLFYNRILQCLVAFELKRGRFKPEYAGKLNFYLNVLDDKVKLPHEKPSIGIILCKEKNNTEVEYSFKSINKAMGVATYKLSKAAPKELKGILPDTEKLKKLL